MAQALAASGSRHGNARFFLSNVARSQPFGLPDITVDWVEWQTHESWHDYAERCVHQLQSVSIGLTRGNKQLGLIRASTAQDLAKAQTIRRRWRVTGLPRDWACDDLCQFLKDWGFEDVSVDERMPWRKQTA